MKMLFIPAAQESPLWWILLKIFLQTIVFWTLFLLVIPGGLMWLESMLSWDRFHVSGQRMWGILFFVLGGSLGLTSGTMMGIYGRGTPLPFDTARHLMIVGPYRFVRNPMAIAGLTQGAAVWLFFGSWLILAYIIVGFFLWNYYVRPIEEQDLLQRFEGDYDAYRRTIRCWIPCWRGYLPDKLVTQQLEGNDK
ncbi:isoprenylcysteine carboxylmethyltransferase family protein [uncultured Gimesia sp.]|uniref:methyltransferase family protein n=1 Tax=uncultured Gimesia sp. TaxID=1678688 RepID=UPI0030D72680|tara:strand:- start:82185 stop:82763 length:579 start_codon:yes stop_codon:yes gene_type:complete